MSKTDYRKIFCEPCVSQSQCGYYRDNEGKFCPMLHYYDKGYHQADKDLALRWEDINAILYIERLVLREMSNREVNNEDLCKEILRRFNEERNK